MEKLHDQAKPLKISTGEQIGWVFSNGFFQYTAFERDNQVKVYVEWGDDMPEDETWFIDWEGARRYLEILLRSGAD